MKITVDFKKKVAGLYGECVEVGVTVEDMYYMTFSRYPNETEWYCDSKWGAKNMYPYFSHGTGSRSCKKSVAVMFLSFHSLYVINFGT